MSHTKRSRDESEEDAPDEDRELLDVRKRLEVNMRDELEGSRDDESCRKKKLRLDHEASDGVLILQERGIVSLNRDTAKNEHLTVEDGGRGTIREDGIPMIGVDVLISLSRTKKLADLIVSNVSEETSSLSLCLEHLQEMVENASTEEILVELFHLSSLEHFCATHEKPIRPMIIALCNLAGSKSIKALRPVALLRILQLAKRLALQCVTADNSAGLHDQCLRLLGEHVKSLSANAQKLHNTSGAPNLEDSRVTLFVLGNALHCAAVASALLELNQKGLSKNGLTELMSRVQGARQGKSEDVAWLAARGLKCCMRVVDAAAQDEGTLIAVKLVLIELYNAMIVKELEAPGLVDQERCKSWLQEAFHILRLSVARSQPRKDWVTCLSCLELALNASCRFPDLQEEVVEFLEYPLEFNQSGILSRALMLWRSEESFVRSIRSKNVEVLMQLASWGSAAVQGKARQALDVVLGGSSPMGRCPAPIPRPEAAVFEVLRFSRRAFDEVLAEEGLLTAKAIHALVHALPEKELQSSKDVHLLFEALRFHIPRRLQKPFRRLQDAKLFDFQAKYLPVVWYRLWISAFSGRLPDVQLPEHLLVDFACDPDLPQVNALLMPEDFMHGDEGSEHLTLSCHEQAEVLDAPSQVVEAAGETLEQSEKEEIRRCVSKIHQLISHGRHVDEAVSKHGLRHVVIIGATGSGKSTLTNSLAGCQLRLVTRAEGASQGLKPNSLCVVGVREGGPVDAVSDIGHELGQSKTDVLRPVSIRDCSLLLWDAPGFEDTKGPEVNISNAVNLSKLLEASRQRGLAMICVIDAHSILTSRGSCIQNTINVLKNLLGGDEARVRQHFGSILWCVSKASNVDEFPICFVRASLKTFLASQGLDLGNDELIQIYDPLGRNPEGISRDELISMLSSVPPVRAGEDAFQTPLTDRDMLFVSKIAQVTREDIAQAMQDGDFGHVEELFCTFQSLKVIRNKQIEQNASKLCDMIREVVQHWEITITSKASDFSEEGRQTLKDRLSLIKNAEVLDNILPDLNVAKRIEKCSREVREAEAKEQRRENVELQNLFASCSSYFNKKMQQLAQSEPNTFVDCDLERGVEALLEEYSSIEEVQHFTNAFSKSRLLLRDRNSLEKFLFGDQSCLAETIRKYEDAVVALFRAVVHRSRTTVLCQRCDECLQKLGEEAIRSARDNYESLCEEEIAFEATPSVTLFQTFDVWPVLESLQSEHPESFELKSSQLKSIYRHVYETAVQFKITSSAEDIRRIHSEFKERQLESMAQIAASLVSQEAPVTYLRQQLEQCHVTYDSLWQSVQKLAGVREAGLLERLLETEQKDCLQSIVNAAEEFVQGVERERQEVDRRVLVGLSGLKKESGDVVDSMHSKIFTSLAPPLLPDQLGILSELGFDGSLTCQLSSDLLALQEIDKLTFDKRASEVNDFLEELRGRALAENCLSELSAAYKRFLEQARDDMRWFASESIKGKDAESMLIASVVDHERLTESVNLKINLPGVQLKLRKLEMERRAAASALIEEAKQFWSKHEAECKQMAASFDNLMNKLKESMYIAALNHYRQILQASPSLEEFEILTKFSFDPALLAQVTETLTSMERKDEILYEEKMRQTREFLETLLEMASINDVRQATMHQVSLFAGEVRDRMSELAVNITRSSPHYLLQLLENRMQPGHEKKLKEAKFAASHAASAESEILRFRDSTIRDLEQDATRHMQELKAQQRDMDFKYAKLLMSMENSSSLISERFEDLSNFDLNVNRLFELEHVGFPESVVSELRHFLQMYRNVGEQEHAGKVRELEEAMRRVRIKAHEKLRAKKRDSLCRAISQLVIVLANHNREDQGKLILCLNELRDLEGSESLVYRDHMSMVSKGLQMVQTQPEIYNFIKTEQYVQLIDRYDMLVYLRDELASHLPVDVSGITGIVSSWMTEMERLVMEEIKRDIDDHKYLEFDKLSSCWHAYSTLQPKFHEVALTKKQVRDRAQKEISINICKVRHMLQTSDESAMASKVDDVISRLLIKSFGVSVELGLVESFKLCISKELLDQMDRAGNYQVGMALKQYCNSDVPDGIARIAQSILSTFPQFEMFSIEMFNEKAATVSFGEALLKLRAQPEDVNREMLQLCYDEYKKTYDSVVNSIISDRSEYETSKAHILQQIHELAEQLKPYARCLSRAAQELGQLLGFVCGHWTFLSIPASLVGVEKSKVRQPHSTQILGILRLLGVDREHMKNHLIQINTGEGKSIALGFTAIVLAMLDFRVDVVCYSQYLSQRDRQAFAAVLKELEVDQLVSYSDFDELALRIMREEVFPEGFPNVRRHFEDFLRSHGKKKGDRPSAQGDVEPSVPRPCVLLLDEVDVFFGDGCYGNLHRPQQDLELSENGTETSFSILNFVWSNRGRLRDSAEAVHELMSLQATRKLLSTFPALPAEFFEIELHKMLRAVGMFPWGSKPELDGLPDYYVDKGRQKIAYIDVLSGVPNYSITLGYVTCFTYLYCCEQRELKLENVKAMLQISPVCGELLYSQLPKCYSYCLGMTGTLDCLSDAQNKLLTEYHFEHKTFLPSTFNKQAVRHEELEVVVEDYDRYFARVRREIESMLQVGRASIVIFKDNSSMEVFARKLKNEKPKMPQYKGFQRLSDALRTADRQAIIMNATRPFAVTLMTRSYGRGTDFACYDRALVKYGGVHIVVTFLPEDDSEAKQIFGRTCRQDDPGSAKVLLFEEDLKYLEATYLDKESKGLEWGPYLQMKREVMLSRRYEDLEEKHCQGLEKHRRTKRAVKYLNARIFDKAKDVFLDISRDSAAAAVSATTSVEICFVMDCTGSMANWITSCKEKVLQIAANIERFVKSTSSRSTVKMSFVAYRDHLKAGGYDNPGIVVCDFTDDISNIQRIVGEQVASGGDDGPEDICGGLKRACELKWQESSRHVFLIADAPCHGSRYHNLVDNFPEGDPAGEVPELQLLRLVRELSCKVYFIKINAYTDKMIQAFNSYLLGAGADQIATLDFSNVTETNMADLLAATVEQQVTMSLLQHRA